MDIYRRSTGALKALFVFSCILYTIFLPPFEIHDEAAHFARAGQIAFAAFPSVHENKQPGALLPLPLAQLPHTWAPDGPGQPVVARSVPRLFQELALPALVTDERGFTGFVYVGSYPPVFYLPQAAGLWIGQHLGLSPLGQFYAGRLAGGVVAMTLVLLAVSIMPFGGNVMLAVSLLPGVCSQFGSYSADSMIFSLAFLTIAVLLRAPAARLLRDRALPVPLVVLLALAKGVYLPIAMAGMAVRVAWRPRHFMWLVLGVVLGLVLFVAWYGFVVGSDLAQNPQQYTSRRTLQHVTAAVPHEQLQFVFGHFGTAAWAVGSTIIERAPVYVMDCIGRFGAFNLFLPLPLYGVGLAVLPGAVVAGPADPLPTRMQRALWLGIVALIVVLIHVALFLTATAAGERYVEGVQGRYFVPILPLGLLAFRLRASDAVWNIVAYLMPLAIVVLSVGGLVDVATAYWRW